MSGKDSLVVLVEGKQVTVDELAKSLPENVVTFGGEKPIKVAQPVLDAVVEMGKKVFAQETLETSSNPITQGFDGVVPFAGPEVQTVPDVVPTGPIKTIPEEVVFTPGVNMPDLNVINADPVLGAELPAYEPQSIPDPVLPLVPETPEVPVIEESPIVLETPVPKTKTFELPEIEITPLTGFDSETSNVEPVLPEISAEVVPMPTSSEGLTSEQPVSPTPDFSLDIAAIQSAFDIIQNAVINLANQNELLQTQLDNQKKVTETLKVGIEGIKANIPQPVMELAPELELNGEALVRRLSA